MGSIKLYDGYNPTNRSDGNINQSRSDRVNNIDSWTV